MLDRNSPIPLYAQLEEILREAIFTGQWISNEIIPSEYELSKTYGLSRMTVRSVLNTLTQEGLLYRVQGKGTFVAEPKISAHSPFYLGIREQLELQGYKTMTVLENCFYISPSSRIRNILKIDSRTEVLFIQRVRFANGTPVSIHNSYIPKHFCPNIEHARLETEQLCNILKDDYNLKPAKVSETLESVLATHEEAKLLGIEAGHPLLLLTDLSQTVSGVIYEYTKIIFRGDKIKLGFEHTL